MLNKKKRRNKNEILKDINTRKCVNAEINSKINIGLVFSCPGQVELKNNTLVSGITGKNLNFLLKELKKCRSDIFLSDKKEDYHINNSSNHVYYKGYKGLSDKRTTPYVVDIKSDKNINRLKKNLMAKAMLLHLELTSNWRLKQLIFHI